MPREYGQGFLNVLAYQDQKKANALAGQRQGMLDTERQEQQQFENVLATGRQDLARGKQQNVLTQQAQGTRQKQLDYVSGVVNRMSGLDENTRSQAWPMVVSDYERVFGEQVPEPIKQYTPELFSKMQAAYGEKEKPAGTQTDIWRYANLAEDQWNQENPGVPMPPDKKMEAMMNIKRAQAGEAGGVKRATLGAELDIKPQIAGAVEAAKAGVQLETGAGIKEATKTGELSATNNMAMYESANNAVSQVAKIDDLITQIEDSDAITGFGAELFKNVERIKASIGSDVAAGKVTDTEILDAMMGSEVFPLIKSLGIGARGMDTPAERKFLRQVMTGQIDLNKATLLRMAKMRRNVAERSLKRYNKRVDSGSFDNFFKYTGIPKSRLEFEKADNGNGVEITTQSEYDKLPSGSVYTEDGQQYRKP